MKRKILITWILYLIALMSGVSQPAPVWHSAGQKSASGTGTLLSVSRPDNLEAGNMVLLILTTQRCNSSATSSFLPPEGFTLIRSEHSTGGTTRPEVAVFYKIAANSEPAVYVCQITQNTDVPVWKALAVKVTGFNPVNPIAATSGSNSSTSSVSYISVPSIITTTGNSLLVAARVSRILTTTTTDPAGMTNRWNANGTGGSDGNTNAPAISVATQVFANPGTTGPRQFSWTSVEARSAALLFAINADPTSADLRIVATVNNPAPQFSSSVIFTLTATNLGVNAATSVFASNPMPDGYGYVSHSATAGTFNNLTGAWNIGILTPGADATLTIIAQVACYTTNHTLISTITGREFDPVPENNTDSAFTIPVGDICPLIANDDQAYTLQGEPVSLNVLSNDLGTMVPSTLQILTQPLHGILQMGQNGIITYLPNGNYTGPDQFTYRIFDDALPVLRFDDATVFIMVEPVFTNPCAEAILAKTYYLPFPEDTDFLRKSLWSAGSSYSPITNAVRNILSIKFPYENIVLTYDHWEDGYEANITLPVQSTTRVWGDGNPLNGIAPGYPDDIIPAGGYIILDNTFPYNPRNPANIYFDGKDKIFTTADVAISKVTGDAGTNRFNIQNVKTDVLDVSRFGRYFIIGFGENTNVPTGITTFRYVGLFVRASADSTIVTLDRNGDGIVDNTSPVLNEGEVWYYDGTASTPGNVATDVNQPNDLKEGAVVIANHPVGVDIVFGSIEASGYATRNLYILPGAYYADTYLTPVYTIMSSAPVTVYFYNTLATPISINYTGGAAGTIYVAPKSLGYYTLPATIVSGYKFTSIGGEAFTAVSVIDNDAAGSNYDWAFTLIPAEKLTTFTSIAWAPGSLDLTSNYNPIWVSPLTNTTLYVKYDGNLTNTNTLLSPCGIPYDVAIPMNALSGNRIFDFNDNNQTGTALYTCDGTPFAAVWGQEAANSTPVASNSIDVGYVMQPRCLDKLIIANDDQEETAPSTPVIINIKQNDFGFLCNINPNSVSTAGLLAPSNGSIVINPNGTITYTPNPGFSGIDEFEYRICAIEYPSICDVALVRVFVTACSADSANFVMAGKVFIEQMPDDSTFNGEALAPGIRVDLYADVDCDGTLDISEGVVQSTQSNLSGIFRFRLDGGIYAMDDFDPTAGFTGNDGIVNWSSNWTEISDNNNFSTGDVRITPDPAAGGTGNAIRIGGPNNGIQRSLVFNDAVSAQLKFRFRRQNLNNGGEALLVQFNGSLIHTINDGNLSPTGTESLTEQYYQEVTVPIETFNVNGSNTLAFMTNGTPTTSEYFWVDNVRLIYSNSQACYIAKINTDEADGAFSPSRLNISTASFSGFGICDDGHNLGVVVNLVASDDYHNTGVDIAVTIQVTENDLVGNPDPATVSIGEPGLLMPLNGTIVRNDDGTITYIPNPGFSGTDQFAYRVCSIDDPNVCDTALVFVNVQCFVVEGKNSISGLVFGDGDLDGILESGEYGLNGFRVELYNDLNGNDSLDPGEPLLDSGITDNDGGYQFETLSKRDVRDVFNAQSYAQNDGNANWLTPWIESDDGAGSPSTGIIQIGTNVKLNFINGGVTPASIRRSANLAGVVDAVLTLNFETTTLEAGDSLNLMFSADGVLFEHVHTFQGNAGLFNLPIPAVWHTSSFTLKLIKNSWESSGDIATVDDIRIVYTPDSTYRYLVKLPDPLPSGFSQTTLPQVYSFLFTGSEYAVCSKNFGLASADLEVLKLVNIEEPMVGDTVLFSLKVTNYGPSNTSGVILQDSWPSGYQYISHTGPGIYDPASGLWTIGFMAPNQSLTLSVRVRVLPFGNYVNSAYVSGDLSDPDPGNNDTERATEPIPMADLSLNKSVAPFSALPGADVTFRITVVNHGPSEAGNVEVTDNLPSGYTYSGHHTLQGDYDPLTGIWGAGSLMPGDSAILTIEAVVNAFGPYTNHATVISDAFDPVIENNLDSASVNVILANADFGSMVNGITGGISVPNVLINDYLNGLPADSALVSISFVSASHPGISLSGFSAIVSSGTPAALYTLIYRLCEKANPAVCDTAIVMIPVVTGDLVCLDLQIKVYLEGAVSNPAHPDTCILPMRSSLNELHLLPGQSFSDPSAPGGVAWSPPGQPYNEAPWFYTGQEGNGYNSYGNPVPGTAGYPSTVVDWVLVSLRTAPDGAGGNLCTRAGLLHQDGHVEFIGGFSNCCPVDVHGYYYVVVEHRNHLIVMSPTALPIAGNQIIYDFTTQQSYVSDEFNLGIFAGQKQVLPGVFALYSANGDQTQHERSDTDINFDDRTFWFLDLGTTGKYRKGDFNMNGSTDNADESLWKLNNRKFTTVPRD